MGSTSRGAGLTPVATSNDGREVDGLMIAVDSISPAGSVARRARPRCPATVRQDRRNSANTTVIQFGVVVDDVGQAGDASLFFVVVFVALNPGLSSPCAHVSWVPDCRVWPLIPVVPRLVRLRLSAMSRPKS